MLSSLNCVWLFTTRQIAASQVLLLFTISWSLHKFMSTELVMPSNHLILGCPLLLLPSVFPSIRIFSSELVLCIRWPNCWSFSFSISPSNEYSGLISFMFDWFDLLAVQGTLKSLLQHHNSKASILHFSAFFMVQLLHPYMTTWKNHSFDYMNFVGKVKSLLFNSLSRFVIAFLPRSKCLLILWLQSLSAVILEPKKRKSVTASNFFPSIYHEVMGLDAITLIVWMLSFKPAFHSPPSQSPRGSLVPLCFLPLEWYHLHIWGCWNFSQKSWF